MKNKIFFCFFIILTLFLAVSLVSASENVTDIVLIDDDSVEVSDDILNESVDADFNKSESQISAVNKSSYQNLKDTFTVTLTSNNEILSNKTVSIFLNNVVYNRTTNNLGQASINFKLKTGNYTVSYLFEGDENYTSSNGTATLIINPQLVTYLKVVDKDINYREGLKSIFQLKLVDVNNKVVANKYVYIKVNGKTLKVKTNSKGYATTYLSLKKGTYTIQFSFKKSGNYLDCNGTFKIKVKSKIAKGYGYWVNKWSMYKVNLKKLSKLGTKHIFLSHGAFSKYGESKVLKWIKKVHKYGMKVHIWMAVFYQNGKFIHAANKNGVYNYDHMNKMIKKAAHYASLKGVDGIHFDYLRYGGNAHKFKNSVAAINYFTKQASITLHNKKANIIVSAAVMPEPNDMKKYYGQDVPTISKYLDVVVPMIYKGNYHASTKWIKKTTNKFIKQSNGAQIWSGLQTYKSDWNIKKLSYKALFKDAKSAKSGGATGIVLFRFGLTQLLNFNKL